MRPVILGWWVRHGGPAWLFPDYFTLAAVAALIASVIALRLARRDGASQVHTAHALACAYVAALAGGYLFEAVRGVPAALLAGSWRPVTSVGRAAYGGLLAAIAAATLYLWAARQPIIPFFDRVAVGAGLTFGLVRSGCFLAGCDYGVPTASILGVRFPPGSLAALEHVRRGLVPRGAACLPVHPTQLYEAALGLVAGALAAVPLLRGRRDGAPFATFLATYAVGRFAIEFLRGDQERGHALGLSTAQWVSVGLVVVLIGTCGTLRRRMIAGAPGSPSPAPWPGPVSPPDGYTRREPARSR